MRGLTEIRYDNRVANMRTELQREVTELRRGVARLVACNGRKQATIRRLRKTIQQNAKTIAGLQAELKIPRGR